MTVPLLEWCSAASAVPPSERERAAGALTGALAAEVLALDAWQVRDDVQTAWFRFECAEGQKLARAFLRDLPAMQLATERAALALLVQPLLTDSEFQLLYRGFDRLLPAPPR